MGVFRVKKIFRPFEIFDLINWRTQPTGQLGCLTVWLLEHPYSMRHNVVQLVEHNQANIDLRHRPNIRRLPHLANL